MSKLSNNRKRLLAHLEEVVGRHCYNGHIQNHGPGGTWEGEGRWFRYPVRYGDEGGWKTRGRLSPSLNTEELLSAHYAFGANNLYIIHALNAVLDVLVKEYGLEIPEDPPPPTREEVMEMLQRRVALSDE